MASAIESVYRTSVAWAERGSEVTVRPCGRLISKAENPAYRERNCTWGLRAEEAPVTEGLAEIQQQFAVQLNWVELGEGGNAIRAFLTSGQAQEAARVQQELELDLPPGELLLPHRFIPEGRSLFTKLVDDQLSDPYPQRR